VDGKNCQVGVELSIGETIRVGLVGARFAARFHWQGYRHLYGVPVQVVRVTSKAADLLVGVHIPNRRLSPVLGK
jgi:hypothetical protein